MDRVVSVYEGDRTALQLTTVPQMRTSVFKDRNADNGRESGEANSVGGLPEGLFKLTDPEEIRLLENLAGSPLTSKNLRTAFATRLRANPGRAAATAASALFLARTIDASPREMLGLLRTGVLILAAKGPAHLSSASTLVGFAVQISPPEWHQRIVSSLRYAMIEALPLNSAQGISFDGMYKETRDTIEENMVPSSDFSPQSFGTDRALVDAGILEASELDDFFWAEAMSLRVFFEMERAMVFAEQQNGLWFDTFVLLGVGGGPFWFDHDPFVVEIPQEPIEPNILPPPAPSPTEFPPAPTPPPPLPTPPFPVS